MDVDLRPTKKLRESAAARSALGPIMEAVCVSPADLASLRVVCDWIQYKQDFREAVVSRPVGDTDLEIAFDLRRCGEIDLAAHVKQALAGSRDQPGVALEPWVPGRDSCIWRFNALYWQALTGWEQATGREYEQALPGGESDARNTEAARELILELFRIWDELDARRALPEELYILELGVGNGNQARTWLDEFVQLDRRHGREYYHRLRYLMGDYSPHVPAAADLPPDCGLRPLRPRRARFHLGEHQPSRRPPHRGRPSLARPPRPRPGSRPTPGRITHLVRHPACPCGRDQESAGRLWLPCHCPAGSDRGNLRISVRNGQFPR